MSTRPDTSPERTLKDRFGTKPAPTPKTPLMSRRRRAALALDEHQPRTMTDASGNVLVMGEAFPIAGVSAPRIAHDEAQAIHNITFDGALPPKGK